MDIDVVNFKRFRTVTFVAFEEFDFAGNKDFQAGLKQITKKNTLAQGEAVDSKAEEDRILNAKIFFYRQYVIALRKLSPFFFNK